MPLLLLPPVLAAEPLEPATVDTAEDVPGPDWEGDGPTALEPATVDTAEDVPGPEAPPDPTLLTALEPATVDTLADVPGPWMPEPDPVPDGPLVPAAAPSSRQAVAVRGFPLATAVQANPKVNDVGSGSFTTVPPGPTVDDVVEFSAGGLVVFRGLASRITAVERAPGNETAQLSTVQCDGELIEWDEAKVLPDFGAQDTRRLGPPTEDVRDFDWSMNGLGTDDPDTVAPPGLISSVGANNEYGTPRERFPLPDYWPDPNAKWMWVRDPLAATQPAGWCYFREPFGAAGRIQVWCVAYDYAEVRLDGVPILTCDRPGVAQRWESDVRDDFHLLTIKAHNGGGKAGLLVSVLPMTSDGRFGEALRRSGGGWKALAYPVRSFRLNPGQVVRRLHFEARRRNLAAGRWTLAFNASHDSAGKPWPANETISVAVGSSYLDVLRQLAANMVDFAPGPTRRTLRMYAKGNGTGTSHTSPFVDGVNVESRTVTTSVR